MIRLDLQTLVVVVIALCVVIGTSMISVVRLRRGSGALWYWSLSLLALAAGSLLLVLRGTIPPLVSVMAGNALIICAVAFLGSVASSITGLFLDGTQRRFFAVLTAPVLGLLYLTVDAIWPRLAYMAAVECYLVGQLALQVRGSRLGSEKPRRAPVFLFEILLWIFFAETAFRAASIFALIPGGAFSQQPLVAVAYLVAILMITVGTCVLVWYEMDVRDDTIARSMDVASGLPNQAVFLQLLEGRLASMGATNGGSIALLRVWPTLEAGAHLHPGDEATILRKAGTRIDKYLDQTDVLARVHDGEFGVLFRGDDTARAVRALEEALGNLQSRPIVGERGHYSMNGNAALMTCGPSTSSPAQVIRSLRAGLDEVTAGGVRTVTASSLGHAMRANGTDRA